MITKHFTNSVKVILSILSCTNFLAAMPAAANEAEIQEQLIISPTRRLSHISPLLFGTNIEPIYKGVFGGISAQMLVNRKFQNTLYADKVVPPPWQPTGHSGRWFLDREFFLSPNQSLGVELSDGEEVGILQGNLCIQASKDYTGYVVVAQQTAGALKSVKASLCNSDGSKTYATTIVRPQLPAERKWERIQFHLSCTADDPAGTLLVSLQGKGKVWLGAASLIPADNYKGFHRGVLDITKERHPTLIRWPSGCLCEAYLWTDGIGPVDSRPSRFGYHAEPFPWFDERLLAAIMGLRKDDEYVAQWVKKNGDGIIKRWESVVKEHPQYVALQKRDIYNGICCREERDVGSFEIYEFAKAVGGELEIIVSMYHGAEKAAGWVEYMNGAVTTKMGRLRAEHGHPQPFGVKYWSIGNEEYVGYNAGKPEAYAEQAIEFIEQMKLRDPSIKCIVNLAGLSLKERFPNWDEKVLSIAGKYADLFALHLYSPEATSDQEGYNYIRTLEKKYLGRPEQVPLIVDEWNAGRGFFASLKGALLDAQRLQVMMRQDGFIAMSTRYNYMLGPLTSSPDDFSLGYSEIDRRGDTVLKLPQYYVMCLLQRQFGSIRVQQNLPKSLEPHECVASIDAKHKRLFISFANLGEQRRFCIRLDDGTKLGKHAVIYCLSGEQGYVSYANPDLVKLGRETIEVAEPFMFTFPARSLTILQFELLDK
jgi:hypothetical protein